MIRKFQILTKIVILLLLISLYFIRVKTNVSFEILMVLYIMISIFIDLLNKFMFIDSKKAGKLLFYKRKKEPRSKLMTFLTATLFIGFLLFIILIGDNIDTMHYFLTFLMAYEIVGFFINFDIVCYIENNVIYFDSIFKKPIKIKSIIKREINSDKSILLYDSSRTIILHLKEEDSLSLQNKIEEIQQTQAK